MYNLTGLSLNAYIVWIGEGWHIPLCSDICYDNFNNFHDSAFEYLPDGMYVIFSI